MIEIAQLKSIVPTQISEMVIKRKLVFGYSVEDMMGAASMAQAKFLKLQNVANKISPNSPLSKFQLPSNLVGKGW
jgi:hypothetical protein